VVTITPGRHDCASDVTHTLDESSVTSKHRILDLSDVGAVDPGLLKPGALYINVLWQGSSAVYSADVHALGGPVGPCSVPRQSTCLSSRALAPAAHGGTPAFVRKRKRAVFGSCPE
jgi:hypothetical protein